MKAQHKSKTILFGQTKQYGFFALFYYGRLFFKARLCATGQASKGKYLHFWYTIEQKNMFNICMWHCFQQECFFPEKYVYFANLRNARDLGTWAVFPCVYVARLAPWTKEL